MLTENSLLNIEKFNPRQHDYSSFDCGIQQFNNFLKLSAKKQQKDNMVMVYVAVNPSLLRILGYHAINVGSINVNKMNNPPKTAPRHGEIPILFLRQVAVDQNEQGNGIGNLLMHHVFERACFIADEVGCHAVLLDVFSDGDMKSFTRRLNWYQKFGFESFTSNNERMYLPLKDIRSFVES